MPLPPREEYRATLAIVKLIEILTVYARVGSVYMTRIYGARRTQFKWNN